MSFHDFVSPVVHQDRRPRMIRRQCACGTHAKGGECDNCRKKRLRLQRRDQRRPDPAIRRARSEPLIRTRDAGTARDFSRLPSYSNANGSVLRATPRLQRQLVAETTRSAPARSPLAEPEAAPESGPEPISPSAAAEQPAGLIAGDDATELRPGQLHKAEFLDQLESAVCAAAEAELASIRPGWRSSMRLSAITTASAPKRKRSTEVSAMSYYGGGQSKNGPAGTSTPNRLTRAEGDRVIRARRGEPLTRSREIGLVFRERAAAGRMGSGDRRGRVYGDLHS